MIIGSDYLVCFENKLVLGNLRYIDGDTVVVSIFGDDRKMPAIISKDLIISSISSEALEAIKERY